MACLERDLKKLVAISTLSQIGLLIFFLSVGHVGLTFFHIVCHALFKSLIFLSCGFFILISLGGQDMRFLGNKSFFSKTFYFILLLSLLSLCGFPFMAGFFSKDLLIDYLFNQEASFFVLLLFLFGCVLSIFYSFIVLVIGLKNFYLGFTGVNVFIGLPLVSFLFFLYFWSIVLGKCLVFFFFDGEYYISSFTQKVMGVLFFFLFTVLFLTRLFLALKFGLISFFHEMLNINYVFSSWFSSKLEKFFLFVVGDLFWLENFGAEGLRIFLVSAQNFLLEKNNFFKISFLFFFSLIIFLWFLPFSL